jgi:hypothetical protein
MDVIDSLLINTHTIACIPPGGRVNTTGEYITVISPDQPLQWLLRWKTGDNRMKAVYAISSNIKILCKIVRLLVVQHDNIELVEKIKTALLAAEKGMDNLCTTYQDVNVTLYLQPLAAEIADTCTYISRNITNTVYDDGLSYSRIY